MTVQVGVMNNSSLHLDQEGQSGRQELKQAPHESLRKMQIWLKAMLLEKQGKVV
jgi:hypothetical protein